MKNSYFSCCCSMLTCWMMVLQFECTYFSFQGPKFLRLSTGCSWHSLPVWPRSLLFMPALAPAAPASALLRPPAQTRPPCWGWQRCASQCPSSVQHPWVETGEGKVGVLQDPESCWPTPRSAARSPSAGPPRGGTSIPPSRVWEPPQSRW